MTSTAIFWKKAVDVSFAGGIILALLSGLLASTKKSVDIYLFDRYVLILPSRLLLLSVVLLLAAFVIWRSKVTH